MRGRPKYYSEMRKHQPRTIPCVSSGTAYGTQVTASGEANSLVLVLVASRLHAQDCEGVFYLFRVLFITSYYKLHPHSK